MSPSLALLTAAAAGMTVPAERPAPRLDLRQREIEAQDRALERLSVTRRLERPTDDPIGWDPRAAAALKRERRRARNLERAGRSG